MKLSKMELKMLIWEWNLHTCNMHLTKQRGPDYREIQTDAVDTVDNPIDSALYIKEYLPFGGSRCAGIFFLDCGAVIHTEHSYEMEYAKQWGFEGIIPYDKLLDYIVNIDEINPDDYHLERT